ncbi:Lrp/AsnC family transcriptional regulator [Deinococcus deserti]|uniref:Putative Transcriptional regulator, AsnC family Transcriptional regulator, Lrp n=1 Tax=Deinococcus deserti (strain DSM 17065 / CIP 109153 / LMG 22923 / VCD115) TaxID=546414 RepID=C1CZ96_DEIDV|nr:Lrp/AsnC family transcriptional regulator [Deinococcus deserti]ACO45134.1 putative Transcriptional regulator, AsnC family; Transcriptional regulator, Lrp [Deinococcus deserti VCD115]
MTYDSPRPLDETGRLLLAALQENARLSFSELGRRVGLSAPAVAERLRRLEDAGVIRGYRAEINPGALGQGLQAYLRLTLRYGQEDAFVAELGRLPEVLSADRVTGEDCYVLKLAVADTSHLETVIGVMKRYGEPVTSIILSSVPLSTVPGAAPVRGR